MTPDYARLVNPIFHYVLQLVDRLNQGEPVDLEFERSRIRSDLEEATMEAASPVCPVREDDFRLARQCLVYWIDEVLTLKTPADAGQWWRDHTLEYEYFGVKDRAWKFYVDGELKARKSSPDVIETWYLALVLGFEGDIRNAFREHLRRDDLPGGTQDEHEARSAWAAELARQIRQQQLPDLPAEPLQGDVRPLYGQSLLQTSLQWVGITLVVFVVLLFFFVRSYLNTGS